MSPEELLPQIQSEEPVTGKGFIAFSRLYNVLGHGGVTEAAVSRGYNREEGGQRKTKAGCVISGLPPPYLSLPGWWGCFSGACCVVGIQSHSQLYGAAWPNVRGLLWRCLLR